MVISTINEIRRQVVIVEDEIVSTFFIVCLLQGYLKALGKSRTAQVKRDARIGEAEARKDAGIKVSGPESHLT